MNIKNPLVKVALSIFMIGGTSNAMAGTPIYEYTATIRGVEFEAFSTDNIPITFRADDGTATWNGVTTKSRWEYYVIGEQSYSDLQLPPDLTIDAKHGSVDINTTLPCGTVNLHIDFSSSPLISKSKGTQFGDTKIKARSDIISREEGLVTGTICGATIGTTVWATLFEYSVRDIER